MPSVSKSSKAKSKSKPTVLKFKSLKKGAKSALKITQKNGVKVAFAKGAKVFAKAAGKAVRAVKAAEKSAEKSVGKMIANAKAANAKSAAAKAGKRVYFFGGGKSDGSKEMKNLLGGKGANLAEMANIGLPVPPGFTITTEVCTEFYALGKKLPKTLGDDMRASISKMEKLVGAKFGDASNPLLVSVRSGARASMPGMMDTILNLGLNDKTAAGLAAKSGNERFAFDSYRRFIAMYGDVVLGMKPENKEDHDPFDELLDAKKKQQGVKLDSDLSAESLKELVKEFKAEIKTRVGVDFPEDPYVQLEGAIKAVFQSWQNDRANLYRRLNNIPAEWGTAVNVQAMVFGNKGTDSATGVCFTRDPASGENVFYGEFL
ncbi:MAG: pyruvate, phosphate dikinase, partial [Myxococcales bacterium]|nr:pyruvate, phosphate dikinase [Myxococcales bacterium]